MSAGGKSPKWGLEFVVIGVECLDNAKMLHFDLMNVGYSVVFREILNHAIVDNHGLPQLVIFMRELHGNFRHVLGSSLCDQGAHLLVTFKIHLHEGVESSITPILKTNFFIFTRWVNTMARRLILLAMDSFGIN